jgi:hypothetical protein
MGSIEWEQTRNKEGEWTYIGSRWETVIDYGIVNEEAWDKVGELRIGEKGESDHLPLEISIQETNHEEEEKRRSRRR